MTGFVHLLSRNPLVSLTSSEDIFVEESGRQGTPAYCRLLPPVIIINPNIAEFQSCFLYAMVLLCCLFFSRKVRFQK